MEPQTAPERRSVALDGLRGYAAAAVVVYHAILGLDDRLVPDVLYRSLQAQPTGHDVALKITLSVLSGEVAVAVFFVISGIVLLRSARRMHGRVGGFGLTCWTFCVHRVLRIWPVMAACIVAHAALFALLNAVWPGWIGRYSLADLGGNLLLERLSVNGATWTLRWEFAAAPLILLCVAAERRVGRWAALILFIYAAFGLFRAHGLLLHSMPLASTLPFLAGGMAIESGWLEWLTRSRFRRSAGLAAACAVLGIELLVPTAGALSWHMLGLALSVPTAVAVAESGEGRALRGSVPQRLGRISFSLYLWNVPMLGLLYAAAIPAGARQHPLTAGLPIGLAAIALTVPIAILSERWLEQPSIRLGRLLTPSRGASRAVPDLSPALPSAPR